MPCAFDCAIDLALQFLDICDDPDLRAKLPLERVLALRADENVRDRHAPVVGDAVPDRTRDRDRKSTRLNSSHVKSSSAAALHGPRAFPPRRSSDLVAAECPAHSTAQSTSPFSSSIFATTLICAPSSLWSASLRSGRTRTCVTDTRRSSAMPFRIARAI